MRMAYPDFEGNQVRINEPQWLCWYHMYGVVIEGHITYIDEVHYTVMIFVCDECNTLLLTPAAIYNNLE